MINNQENVLALGQFQVKTDLPKIILEEVHLHPLHAKQLHHPLIVHRHALRIIHRFNPIIMTINCVLLVSRFD